MSSEISFFVPGVPVAKGRPLASVRMSGGEAVGVNMRTPDKTANYEGLVASVASMAARRKGLRYGPGEPLMLTAFLCFPTLKKDKRKGSNWHVGKPDADNVIKAILDGLILAAVIADDSQVCVIAVQKLVETDASLIGANCWLTRLPDAPTIRPPWVTP